MEGGGAGGGGGVSIATTYRPGYVSVPDSTIRAASAAAHSHRMSGSRPAGQHQPIQFPPTRAVLWDHRNTGPSLFLHPAQCRNPVLVLEEKTLRLAHRFAEETTDSTYTCSLFGSVGIDSDGEGLSVTIDRFDPGRGSDYDQMPDELVVPCQVEKNSSKPRSSVEDYISAIEQVGQRCGSKSAVDLSRLLAVRAYCSYHGNRDNFIFHMDFDLVMPKTKLKVTPVNPVPIMATALSKNLSGPLSMSGVQGEAKSGYLSMDQTRKLLLVLESDPKVSRLPLVGLWLSGVQSVQDPFVWANCLRYLYNSSLQERVCGSGSEPFLVVLYLTTHSQPQFYECVPSDGKVKLDIELRTCHEVIQLPKLCLERAQSPLELELTTVESGPKLDLLQAALHSCSQWLEKVGKKDESGAHLSGSLEDMMPRASPAPHRTKAPVIKPTVPEVSLLLDENVYSNNTMCSESTQSAKLRQKARPPLKPVNRGPSTSVPASPTINGSSSLSKRSVHSSPNSPNVPQGQWTNQPAMGHGHAPVSGPTVGGAPTGAPMMSGQMFTAPMSQPYRLQSWQYQQPVYGPFPPQQVYIQQPNIPAHYGYVNSGPPHLNPAYAPRMMGANPRTGACGPVSQKRGDQRMMSSNGANVPSQGSHLAVQDSGRSVPVSANNPRTTAADCTASVSATCACCSHGQHIKSHQLDPPATTTKSVTTKDAAIHGANSAPSPQWPSPIMSDKQPMTQSMSASPESVQVQRQSLDSSPAGHNSTSDSGVHITQSTQSHTMNSTQPMSPDVYALLRMQDEQLKMLREQLSQLLAKQSTEGTSETKAASITAKPNMAESATQSSNVPTPQTHSIMKEVEKQTCSIAINTSLWWPNGADRSPNTADHTQSSSHSQLHSKDVTDEARCRPAKPGPVHPPVHHPLNAQRMCSEEEGLTVSNETLSLGEFHLSHQLDRTEESMMSEMLVDMPAYTSMSPDKSGQHSSSGYGDTDDSNRSPMLGESVSMYQQGVMTEPSQPSSGEDTGLGESQPDASLLFKDQKRFYENLMGNVQKLLGQSDEAVTFEESSTHDDSVPQSTSNPEPRVPQSPPHQKPRSSPSAQRETPGHQQSRPAPVFHRPPSPEADVAEQTRQQLAKMGINMDDFHAEKSYRLDQTFFFDSAMLPKINYVSMMLDRDSDTSADADALSMKYLSDEQLSELARLRLSSSHNTQRNSGLDRVVASTQKSTPEVTTYGLPANHMSFATKKYMERYGLTKDQQDHDNTTSDNATYNNTTEDASEPSALNVRDFLKTLADRSLELSRLSDPLDQTLQASPKVAGNCLSRDTSLQGMPLNYYSDGDSFHIQGKPSSTPADRRPSVISDTTPNRTPHKTPVRRPRTHKHRPTNVSDTTPARVFEQRQRHNDSDPLPAQDVDSETQQKYAAYLAVGGDNARPSQAPQQKAVGMVLDIERLKELPKLL